MDALPFATAEARACGVTRLAEITDLDVLGVPVFQAVRPLGRALSVHQGKGLTPDAARIGALMEAVESDHAEAFAGACEWLTFDDLAPAERAPELADFAEDRSAPPDAARPRAWVAGRRLTDGGVLWVPFDCVSLDYTWRGDPLLDRSSNGLGAAFDAEAAAEVALLEVIERDAFHAWLARSLESRAESRIATDTIPFAWFRETLERCRAHGLRLAVHALPTLVGLPAFACEITEPGGRRRAIGTACRAGAADALARAVTEAAQSRLTCIAGARDDLLLGGARDAPAGPFGLGLPLPAHRRAASWSEAVDRAASDVPVGAAALARRLEEAGYPGAAIADLSRQGGAVKVVKAVAPGLGAFGRGRRNRLTSPLGEVERAKPSG